MNQILAISMPNKNEKKAKKQRRPIGKTSLIRFFAISILVFGVFMVGTGAYAIYTNEVIQEEQNVEPTISIENKTDTTILLKVMHKKKISKVEYGWNDEDREILEGNNGTYLEKQISIPSGKNTLHILVEDENGKNATYEKEYEIESNINLEVSGNNIKITYDGDKLISYMTYRWDDEEEQTIEINDTSFEKQIEAMKGLHTLTVIVVDEENHTDTKVQKIEGVAKPNLIIDLDSELKHFVIKTSDDAGLAKIEFKINQDDAQTYMLNLEEKDLKELNYIVPIEFISGDNFIEVKVYNKKGIYSESAAKRTQT